MYSQKKHSQYNSRRGYDISGFGSSKVPTRDTLCFTKERTSRGGVGNGSLNGTVAFVLSGFESLSTSELRSQGSDVTPFAQLPLRRAFTTGKQFLFFPG